MNYKQFKKLVNNQLQKEWELEEEDFIYNNKEAGEFLEQCEVLATNLERDNHRWYSLGITVYQCPEKTIFGIRHGIDMYAEGQVWEDCCTKYEVFEMEAVPSVTYKIKR